MSAHADGRTRRASLRREVLLALLAILAAAARAQGPAAAGVQPIPPIGKKIPPLFMNQALKPTVSGLSDGAAWSVQFSVAFSGSVGGAAIFSGKAYHCMKGTCVSNCSGVHNTHCHYPESEWGHGWSVDGLVNLTRYAAAQGYIDSPSSMASNRYYFFRGRSDTVYLEGAMNATHKFFSAFAQPKNMLGAPRSSPRALLTPQVNPRSRYRCGKST